MSAVGYRFRAELRQTWRTVVVLSALLGIVGGVALVALVGARRTSSVVPRLLANTSAHDVLVNPDNGSFSAIEPAAVLALPHVASGGILAGLFTAPADADGMPDFETYIEPLGSDGIAGYELSRPVLRSGRLPHPNRAEEILLSPSLARRYDVAVGDSLAFVAIDFVALQAWEAEGGSGPPPMEPVEFVVSGIGDMPDRGVADLIDEGGRVLFSPAYTAEQRDNIGFWGASVRLHDPDARSDFEAAVRALAPGEAVAFQWTDALSDRFERSVRPQAVALSAFGLVVGAGALLAAATTLSRHGVSLHADRAVASAMGLPRRHAIVVELGHALVVGVVGAVAAAAVAIGLSPLTPIGPARRVEPNPGVHIDAPVLAVGVCTSIAVLVVIGLLIGRRSASNAPRKAERSSRLAVALAGLGVRHEPVIGARLAFEPRAGGAPVPVLSTVGTVAVAVAAVIASATFARSLDHVIDTPRLHGSNWDGHIAFTYDAADVSGLDDLTDATAAAAIEHTARSEAERIARRDDVDGVSVGTFAQIELVKTSVPAFGLDVVAGAAHPTIAAGRPPARPDEIVLGARTMHQLGVGLGDEIAGADGPLRVVGRAVFPGFSIYSGQDSTELGVGAWLTVEGVRRAGIDFSGVALFIDVAPGHDVERVLRGLTGAGGSPFEDDDVTIDANQPIEMTTLELIRSTPTILAIVLGAVGAVAATHALLAAIRARRRDMAMLRVLGLARRHVIVVIGWQATLTAAAALIVGLPAGLVAGRWSWRAVIESLGGVAVPVTPVLTSVLLLLAVVVVANLVAALPSRRAARLRPAEILRAE